MIELAGDVDVERMRSAATRLLDHHRVLRSGYVRTVEGAVVAVVPPRIDPDWATIDLRDEAGESDERLDSIAVD
ncbi:hypothetical protein G3I15_44895, partial [Streptomyces sp. SID10244]|nr:hypothetical protein [Streptomyces sp. SID10244]